MTDTRRLSAKMRERWTAALSHNPPGALLAVAIAQDALHDLDVADRELDEAQALVVCGRNTEVVLQQNINNLRAELAQAQATIAQQGVELFSLREALRGRK